MKLGTLRRIAAVAVAASLVALIAAPALAQAPTPPAPTPNKGDTAWMMTASALVLLMTIPGLALFYGGLVRTKNMLSMLMQVFFIVCIVCILWVRLRLQPGLLGRRRHSTPSSAASPRRSWPASRRTPTPRRSPTAW